MSLYSGHPDQFYGPNTYSQHGEDLMICNLFQLMKIEKPNYLDIGAHHPFNISNTALLYERGSRGINVEANPKLMDEFTLHRPEDININIGIATKPGILRFHLYDERSGLNSFKEEWVNKFKKICETIDLPVTTINHIVEEYCGGMWPDFLNLDIEGMDVEILSTVDFKSSSPKVICLEHDGYFNVPQLMSFQNLYGYIRFCRMQSNLILIHKDHYFDVK